MKYMSIGFAVGVLCLISAGVSATGVQYVEGCFQTLGPGGRYALRDDLVCGCGGDAITLLDSTKLNLRGYTLSCRKCDDPDAGIQVDGDSVSVRNGTVSDCERGVRVEGGENHRFVYLTLANNSRSGLRSDGSKSLFFYNDAHDNGRRGIRIGGDGNRLINNHAWENGRQGFGIEGDGNKLGNNHAWENGRQGIVIEGDDNRIVHNTANGNCRDGIEIEEGDKNRLIINIANGNGNPGACPEKDSSDYALGIDYRPWFYAGINITKAETSSNLVMYNKTKDNLGCWVPPEDRLEPDDFSWERCIGRVPIDPEDAVDALRNRNLWDENAEITEDDDYRCNSINKWVSNRADGVRNAQPECPCIEGIGEPCKLAAP